VKRTASDPRARRRRAALSALRRAKRAAERAGVTLSEWEGEFLESVESRVAAFGRAFADAQKGPAGAPLSNLQDVKLKEISRKARGKSPKQGAWGRSGPKSRSNTGSPSP